jgi:ABC-2 type transport system permease protein
VELVRFALYAQVDVVSLSAVVAWLVAFLGLAILGYDPEKGFVATTGKGE